MMEFVDASGVSVQTPEGLTLQRVQIGNTPIVPVTITIQGRVHQVALKLEGMNPTGSMKDRTGHALIHNLEQSGRLQEDSVIIESSSGNLGVALAFICKTRGYRLMVVIDPKTTRENHEKLHHWGADVVMVEQPDENGGYLLSRLACVQQLCKQHSNYIWTNQYANPANPAIHYCQTGPEIYQQMQQEVGAIFIPVSTGGTLAGIGRFFREVSPQTQIIGVDAVGSVIFGTPPAPRKLTGIGSSQPSHFLEKKLYDHHQLIDDLEAFTYCRALHKATGIQVGGSSGAVLAACVRYLKKHPETSNSVCICADRGENYSQTIFSDDWFDSLFAKNSLLLDRIHEGLPEICLQKGKFSIS